jgi:hypothetical protein
MFLAGFDCEKAVMNPHIVCDVILQFAVAAALGVDFEFPFGRVERFAIELIAPDEFPTGQGLAESDRGGGECNRCEGQAPESSNIQG